MQQSCCAPEWHFILPFASCLTSQSTAQPTPIKADICATLDFTRQKKFYFLPVPVALQPLSVPQDLLMLQKTWGLLHSQPRPRHKRDHQVEMAKTQREKGAVAVSALEVCPQCKQASLRPSLSRTVLAARKWHSNLRMWPYLCFQVREILQIHKLPLLSIWNVS